MTEEKVVTKSFTFHIGSSHEASAELIQLILLAIHEYEEPKLHHAHPCCIPSTIRYLASLYGVTL